MRSKALAWILTLSMISVMLIGMVGQYHHHGEEEEGICLCMTPGSHCHSHHHADADGSADSDHHDPSDCSAHISQGILHDEDSGGSATVPVQCALLAYAPMAPKAESGAAEYPIVLPKHYAEPLLPGSALRGPPMNMI